MSKLKLKDFKCSGEQWVFRFHEKGGKSREIPVRHDLEQFILAWVNASGVAAEDKETPSSRRSGFTFCARPRTSFEKDLPTPTEGITWERWVAESLPRFSSD